MKLLPTFIGSAIAGAAAFAVWPELWKSYGIMGGWLAATICIGIMWYMNHWLGVIHNPEGKIWVDQGWAIGAAGIVWGAVRFGSPIAKCLPTLICLCVGGALAGIAASAVKRRLPRFNSPPNPAESVKRD